MQYLNADGKYILRSPCEKHEVEVEFWVGVIGSNKYVTIKVNGEEVKTSINSKSIHFRLKELKEDDLKGAS